MRFDTSTVVLASGCFDWLHYGHIRHLKAASQLGDHLVVAVTKNEYVNKGPDRPLYDESQRVEMINELRCVDEVLLVKDSLDALVKVKPDIFVKGREYDGKIQEKDAEYCRKHGIQIAFTDEETYSSTELINGNRFRRS